MAGVKLSTDCQESETNGLLRAIPRTLDKQISYITLIEICYVTSLRCLCMLVLHDYLRLDSNITNVCALYFVSRLRLKRVSVSPGNRIQLTIFVQKRTLNQKNQSL